MKANKDLIIIEILKAQAIGTTFAECFKLVLSKFKLSEPTFSTYWKEAKEINSQNLEEIKKQLAQANFDAEKEFESDLILTKKEALEILTRIIRGEMELRINKEGIEYGVQPSFFDRNSALGTMNRMRGWDLPLKIDNTIEVGKSIEKMGTKLKFNLDLSGAI